MIDLRGKNHEQTDGKSHQPRFRILGLGRAGIATLDRLVLNGFEHLDMVAMDMDEQSLLSTVVQRRLLLGAKSAGGLGCWGDPHRAYQIAQEEEASIQPVLEGCDYLLIVSGLGGGTGGGVLPKVLEMAQAQRIQTLVFATLPYQVEGALRYETALEQLKQIRQNADCVLTTSLERLTACFSAETTYRKGYEWLNDMESKALYSIMMLLEQPGLFPLTFADLRSLYGRLQGYETPENCLIGYSEGELNLENEALLDDLLEGPLLSDENVWREMDRALLSVSGGKELSVLEIQEVMRQLQNRFARPLPVAVSAHFEGPQDGKIRLTLMLAKTTESENPVVIHRTVETPRTQPAMIPLIASQSVNEQFEPVIFMDMPGEEESLKPEIPLVAGSASQKDFNPIIKHDAEGETELGLGLESVSIVNQKTKKVSQKRAKQEEFELDSPNRGRFEKASETIWKGENLDQPTFKRRGIYVRL